MKGLLKVPSKQDEHMGDQDPTAPEPPTPSLDRGSLGEDIAARRRPRLRARGCPRQRRVTALYAQLLRELEAEVRELQRALAARDEAVLHRERRIRQLEAETRQLRSHVRSLEEENDLLSSGGDPGGPLDTAATGTRSLLVSGTRCIGISDSNVQFLKRLVGLLESNVATEAGGLQPSSSPIPGEQSCAPAAIPQSPCACCLPGGSSPCPGSKEGPGHKWGLTPAEYVTSMCGRGCNFNAVINSKCGTSRRAVKKLMEKME